MVLQLVNEFEHLKTSENEKLKCTTDNDITISDKTVKLHSAIQGNQLEVIQHLITTLPQYKNFQKNHTCLKSTAFQFRH